MLPNFARTNALPAVDVTDGLGRAGDCARVAASTKVIGAPGRVRIREQARRAGSRSATLSLMATLGVGDTAPDFEVVDTDGQMHKLSEMVTRGPVILAFFPKAFTPG
jgi:hypothetical protein